MNFERAQKIADAVLYEGYLLYPYRASSRKNQLRFQFGVLAPRAWSEAGGCEEWWMQTECVIEAKPHSTLAAKVRFLQLQQRKMEAASPDASEFHPIDSIEVDGQLFTCWEEGIEREVAFDYSLNDLITQERILRFRFDAMRSVEAVRDLSGSVVARIVRQTEALAGVIGMSVERLSQSLFKLRLRIENETPWNESSAPRDDVMRGSLIGAHSLIGIEDGSFISQTDPPESARDVVAACRNVRTWPVLVGDDDTCDMVLSSPIILQDHPRIAPESPGDLFDGTEIDEILILRTLTLTEEEKREARATDARAAAIIERVDTMPQELLDRLHGSIRYLRSAATTPEPVQNSPSEVPWWDPGADASVSPSTDSIGVNGVSVCKGRRVRLRPGSRRSDAQDMFFEGRVATVQGIFIDVEDRNYLAVTLEDDPASELHEWYGRYLYFAPDEIEPLGDRE
jgi:hypothetical protein